MTVDLLSWLTPQLEIIIFWTYIFFTNKPSLIQQCYVVPGISNHESVMITIKSAISYAPSNRYKVYLWKKANISEMRNEMLNFADEYCHQHTAETPVENLWIRF